MAAKIENFTIDLQPEIDPVHGPLLQGNAQLPCYDFKLCRRRRTLPGLELDECWIDRRRLFPVGGRSRALFDQVIDYFWACCLGAGTYRLQEVQEVFLLASILPQVRREGSRRIVADAINSNRGLPELTQELTGLVEAGRLSEMDLMTFREQTANLIGPQLVSAAVSARYATMKEQLLDSSCKAINASGAAAGRTLMSARWQEWMSSIGRHGEKEARTVLDILSYESRTAFAQCYSSLWVTLLPRLHQRFMWSDETARFHQFWHLEKRASSNESDDNDFHVFHGLPFAFHPACNLFMGCRPGQEILAAWLMEPSATNAGRLMNGLCCAVSCYENHRQSDKQRRRDEPHLTHFENLDLHESTEERPEDRIEDDPL